MLADIPTDAPLPVLLLKASGHVLAVRQGDVTEVLPLPRLTPLPGSPSIVSGCFHLGAETVLVLPLAALLGLAGPAEGEPLYHHLLLLAEEPGRAGLALRVDRVLGLVGADPSLLPPGNSFNDCVDGEVRVEGNLVPLLAAPRLLTRYEVERLTDFAGRAVTRETAFVATDGA